MEPTERYICWALGLALCLWAAFSGISRLGLLRRCQRTQGRVVDQVLRESTDASTYHYPVVEFTTRAGQLVRFQGAAGSAGGAQSPTGSAVEVLYEEADPSRARINSFVQFWLLPVGLGVMGLALALVPWLVSLASPD